jgi:hypothetical protein
LVEPQNQDRRLGGQRQDPGAPKSFEVEDTRRDRKGYTKGIFPKSFEGRSPGIRPLVLQRHIPKCPWWASILVYDLGVFYSFGCLHIYSEERGWQLSLETLAHLVFLFSLPIFPRISIRLVGEFHGEIFREGWMLRRQARPCTNLSWLYRRFGIVISASLFGGSLAFSFFG